MHKALELIKRSYIKSLTYRSEVAIYLLLHIIPLITMFAIWRSIYANQAQIKGYSLAMMLQYYFLATIIGGITGTHFEQWRVREIREGKIDFFLTRPLSYLKELLLCEIGGKGLYLTFALPFFLSVLWLTSFNLGLSLFPTASWTQWLIFISLLFIGHLVDFSLATIIVLSGFWFEHAEGGEHFKWILIGLFGGWLIPIPLMPAWLRSIVTALPLKYTYAVPIGVIQGTMNLGVQDLIYIVGFLLGLWLIIKLMWRHAQYQYSSHGG